MLDCKRVGRTYWLFFQWSASTLLSALPLSLREVARAMQKGLCLEVEDWRTVTAAAALVRTETGAFVEGPGEVSK